MEGIHYLNRIRGNYTMVARGALVHEAKRGEGGEHGRLQRLREARFTDDEICLAGLTHLSGPPAGVENELWQRLLDAGVSNDDIHRAGVERLAGFPPDVQAATDELNDEPSGGFVASARGTVGLSGQFLVADKRHYRPSG